MWRRLLLPYQLLWLPCLRCGGRGLHRKCVFSVQAVQGEGPGVAVRDYREGVAVTEERGLAWGGMGACACVCGVCEAGGGGVSMRLCVHTECGMT